jgi:hypothetical protein
VKGKAASEGGSLTAIFQYPHAWVGQSDLRIVNTCINFQQKSLRTGRHSIPVSMHDFKKSCAA